MSKKLLAVLFAFSSLLAVNDASAQSDYRATSRAIEQEYLNQNDGRGISDAQLGYYLDRYDTGWTMEQIRRDIAATHLQNSNNPGYSWRPQTGWTAREIVCSSDNGKFRECRLPFRGRAVLTDRISSSACIEGQSWGQRQDMLWVDKGCRGRFKINPESVGNYTADSRTLVCRSNNGKYHQCKTGFNGRVQLLKKLNDSAACIAGSTWGQREGMVWVSRNCRAQFSSVNAFSNNRDYSVTCSSNDNMQTRCNWDARHGQPRIVQQLSQNACVKGRTWGYDNNNSLWVTGGCRARFGGNGNNYSNNFGNNNTNYSNNNWRGDANYEVICSSENNALARCDWDERYGQPRLVQQLSQNVCIEGRTWGYDNNNSLWVTGGCRARYKR